MLLCLAVGAMAAGSCRAEDPVTIFRTELKTLTEAAAREQRGTITGREGWRYLPAELRSLSVGPFWGEAAAAVSRATKPDQQDPLPAIVDFNNQLAANGIELIVMPVPAKAVIYPEFISAKTAALKPSADPQTRLDPDHLRFFEELRKQGVTVLDLVPAFVPARNTGAKLYCQTDTHWAPAGIRIAAQAIAGIVKERPWFRAVGQQPLAVKSEELTLHGDLLEPTDSKDQPVEKLNLTRVVDKQTQEPPADSPDCPLLLLGDSHVLFLHRGGEMQATGAGLADQLAGELGFAVDVIGVMGSGATPARINFYRLDETAKKAKKMVVWCFTEREFTESTGWRKFAVFRP
jgi:alginate O-acetyltransferase complex protein AlgJ